MSFFAVLGFLLLAAALLYIIWRLEYIIKNLPTDCSNVNEFDPTKTYVINFDVADWMKFAVKVAYGVELPDRLSGSVTGKATSKKEGTFNICFQEFNLKDPTKPEEGYVPTGDTKLYENIPYTYNKENCTVSFDGTACQGLVEDLKGLGIELDTTTQLVPNDGMKLTAILAGKINLHITGYPGNAIDCSKATNSCTVTPVAECSPKCEGNSKCVNGECVCTPVCKSKILGVNYNYECGDDGCGGECGTCDEGLKCNNLRKCVADAD